MNTRLPVFRLLAEVIVAIAVAEVAVMFALPMADPGIPGAIEGFLDATTRSMLAGLVIVWGVHATGIRCDGGHRKCS